ncbi:MAG TPA: MG2 domain-containing protein, partial [Gallionellaceae bacterium]
MNRLRAMAKMLLELVKHSFWLCAAFVLKPLMDLVNLIPKLKKPHAWWWLQEKISTYNLWANKKVAWAAAAALIAVAVWALTPAMGWKAWWEWQTFSGARDDSTGVPASTTPPNRAGVYISGIDQLRYYITDKDGRPQPVALNFPMSVAPLTNVGKEAEGVEMSPKLAGKWTWVSPNRLEFRPEEEWPVGEQFRVTLSPKALAPHITLADYTATFQTPRFDISVRSATFYQDPEQVTLRKAVFDVTFTYPVNPESFEKHVRLSADGAASGLFSKVFGGMGGSQKFTVTYNNDKTAASVHSDPLPIPETTASLTLIIADGTTAQHGGRPVDHEIKRAVEIPGLYNLNITELRHMIVTGENGEPENILQMSTSMAVAQSEMERSVKAWLLPAKHQSAESGQETSAWNNLDEVTDDVLKQSTPVALGMIAAERENIESHAFKFTADPGRYMYVRVAKGLSSAGGYQMGAERNEIVRVKHSAPELSIMSKGSLLAMSGEKKLPVIVRDLPGMRMEVGRLLPHQLQHLVSQSQGDMSRPEFYSGITPDDLTERFEKKIPLNLEHGKTHYETIDFADYLRADATDRRGVFLLTIEGYDPKVVAGQGGAYRPSYQRPRRYSEDEEGEGDEGGGDEGQAQLERNEAVNPASMRDTRLVIVTDLGVVSKLALDGSRDVFVQSIANGLPVSDATVEIWARNGAVLVSNNTDGTGMAHLPSVTGLVREKSPVVMVVRKGGDLSFLPLNRYGRNLDTSRFDVGGVHSASLPNQIQAFLFSDRGIYRPGDTINVGIVAKSSNWAQKLVDMPVEVEVIDARGLVVRRDKLKLGAGGMAEFSHTTQDSSPTGNYTINLNLARDSGSALPGAPATPALQLGSTTVKVQEFMPDRMKVTATLSSEATEGWVSPTDLKARVNVLNLFGTPATNRRVEGELTLTPAYPAFRSYPQYSFSDPSRAKDSFHDKLERKDTDDKGVAEFELGLQRYKQATYQLHVLVNAFEPEGGRSVSAEAATMVSDRPYLIGYKADGDLGYIDRGSERHVSLIAIDPKAKKTAVANLHLVRLERKVVSVLVKQPNGLFKYESRQQESVLKDDPFKMPAAGANVSLATQTPGNFAYVVRDANGLEISRVNYSVAGVGNVSRTLDRNAELQMTLNKKDYAPGEEIEISIRAPYAGAGLITIERDKVYAHRWFKASETASVQKITLPAGFEGNGYVSVQFTRDLASREIYMSPMSYGVMPFATSLSRRTTPITLHASELIKPGQTAKFTLESKTPSRAIVFAVDEGILQVARYQTPDPLKYFFQKRALEVNTQQTLDLILPEFKRLMQAAAPGGDAEATLGKHLNPFKRRTDKPVVYWSGIVQVDGSKEFTYTVPESFNGALRVMAVTVNDDSVASATATTTVRGDIVLLPNVPVAITPGDEVEIGIGVANNAKGSGKDAPVALSLSVS